MAAYNFNNTNIFCRLYDAICNKSPHYFTTVVGQENLLLQTYKVKLPAAHRREPTVIPGSRDLVATSILTKLQPALLRNHIPLTVYGDGNCMFRAISRIMYGTESHHALLRLLTVLEIACDPWIYDSSRTDYQNPFGDMCITCPPYAETLQIASKLGGSTELIHLHAVSSVIGEPIESVYPLHNDHMVAWNRVLIGRNVQQRTANVKLMWSATSTPADWQTFSGNHFVPLYPTANASNIQPTPSVVSACRMPKKRRCKKPPQRPPSAPGSEETCDADKRDHTLEPTQEPLPPPSIVSIPDDDNADALPISNATSYVIETDQTRTYDGDAAMTEGARASVNDFAGSNVDDSAVDIDQLNASIRELSILNDSDQDDVDSGSGQERHDDEHPQIITTQKGHPKLCYHGYMYHMHAKRPRDGLRWRCKERLLKCGGTVITDVSMTNPQLTIPHNHAADNSAVLVAAEVVKMKKRAAETREKPSVILAQSLRRLPEESRAQMISSEHMKRTLRSRRAARYPPVPQRLAEFEIPEAWTKTDDGSKFVIFDNGKASTSRIVAMGLEPCLKHLATSSKWFMDGNFAIAPKGFSQVCVHQ